MTTTQRYAWPSSLRNCLVVILLLPLGAVRGDLRLDTKPSLTESAFTNNRTRQLLSRHIPCDWSYIATQSCQPVQPGDDHCTQAAKKGEQLSKMMTSGNAPQSQFHDPEDLDRYGYITQVHFDQGEELSGTLLNALGHLHIPTDAAGWIFFNQKHLKASTSGAVEYPATNAYFVNFANMEHGVIIADNNKGPVAMNAQAKSPASHVVPLKQWSDVLFLSWQQHGGQANLRKLEHVFRDNISNQQTIEVMRSIAGKDDLDASDMWPGHEIHHPDVGLKAAIGTPNGNGVAWLAAQHQADIGTKTIDQVNIFNCGTEDYGTWCMYLHLSDFSSPSEETKQLVPRLVHCDWDSISTQTTQPTQQADDHCTKAAKRGEQLLHMMTECNADPSRWTSYLDLARYGYNSRVESGAKVNERLNTALSQLHIPSESSGWTRLHQFHDYASRPPNQGYPATGAKFLTNVNYEHGVIIAEDNYGPDFMTTLQPRPRAKDKIVPLKQWSDVVFLQWRETAQMQSAAKSRLRKLEHVIQDAVANPDTVELMRSMVGKQALDEGDRWPGSEYRYPDAKLKAAIGSPNGNGIAWLVAQHKEDIGKKLIDRVNVFNCGSGPLPQWCLYIHLTDLPSNAARL